MVFLFFLMATVAVLSAIAVVALRSPMYSALCLVLNLLTVAGLFAQLEAHFLSTIQILVYAGAIMVLVLFVLMLLNLKVEPMTRADMRYAVGAVVVGGIFVAVIAPVIDKAFANFGSAAPATVGTVRNIGEALFTRYLFPFEIASFLLLGAIVGAVLLAKRGPARSPGGSRKEGGV
jgi:NADH-quinone oxidoreductase subunit J